MIKTRKKVIKKDSPSDQLDTSHNRNCTNQQQMRIKSVKHSEEMSQLMANMSDKSTRDLQSWFIGLLNEGLPVPSFLKVTPIIDNDRCVWIVCKGSSVVNSFYGGVNRPGLSLAGAALLGTGG